jgi:hypothetical protein
MENIAILKNVRYDRFNECNILPPFARANGLKLALKDLPDILTCGSSMDLRLPAGLLQQAVACADMSPLTVAGLCMIFT